MHCERTTLNWFSLDEPSKGNFGCTDFPGMALIKVHLIGNLAIESQVYGPSMTLTNADFEHIWEIVDCPGQIKLC